MAIDVALIEYGLVSRKGHQSQFNPNAPFTSIANVRGYDIFPFRWGYANASVIVFNCQTIVKMCPTVKLKRPRKIEALQLVLPLLTFCFRNFASFKTDSYDYSLRRALLKFCKVWVKIIPAV